MSQKLGKPILKLTDDDYNTHGMDKLITEKGPAYNMNIKIFNELQHTITGWPGGKPNVDDSQRPERANPAKRMYYYSLHIQMMMLSLWGTFIKLADQGHNVHVAYQTSGNAAVWDDDVLRYLEFAEDFSKLVGFDDQKVKNIYKDNVEIFEQKTKSDRYRICKKS